MSTDPNPLMPDGLKFLRVTHVIVAVVASLGVLVQLFSILSAGTMFNDGSLTPSARDHLQTQTVVFGLIGVLISGSVLATLWLAAITLLKTRPAAQRWSNIYGISSLVAKIPIFLLAVYTTYAAADIVKASAIEKDRMAYELSGRYAIALNVDSAVRQQFLLMVVLSAYPIFTLILINRNSTCEFLRKLPTSVTQSG